MAVNQEKILKTLEDLGLRKLDSQVYVFLGRKGSKQGKEITAALKLPKQRLYEALKNLQGKGLVSASLEHPAKFSALPFENVLDMFVKSKMEEARRIQREKTVILETWKAISFPEATDYTPKFNVLEGKNFIYPRLKQMIGETKTQLSIAATASSIVAAEQFGLINAAMSLSEKKSTEFRCLIDVSKDKLGALDLFLKSSLLKNNLNIQVRSPQFVLKSFSRMVIRDDAEIAFFVKREQDSANDGKSDDICLWTDCRELVSSFLVMFEDLWRDSIDINKKIKEIKTGETSPTTVIIKNAEDAWRRYIQVVQSARKSIFSLTSAEGLTDWWKEKSLIDEWVSKGISIKIMAPVTNENTEAVRGLLEICEVKHVPTEYVGITIIDGKQLFQVKSGDTMGNRRNFENATYSDDPEYVKKIESMLYGIWNNSFVPSQVTLRKVKVMDQQLSMNKSTNKNLIHEYKKVLGLKYTLEPQIFAVSEKALIEKIANAQRSPAADPERDVLRFYGSKGSALIYPPKELNLPSFLIEAFHHNDKSSFGETNTLTICAQAKVADQDVYIPTAFITDNPAGYRFRKQQHRNRQTTEVTKLLRKGQINIEVTPSGIFAGWTANVPLLPPKYNLPSASIILERSGKLETGTSELIGPLERKIKYEYNRFEAFITFIHPSTRYYGPASNAFFYRDYIVTAYPPSVWKTDNP